jgi:hypothetical protein
MITIIINNNNNNYYYYCVQNMYGGPTGIGDNLVGMVIRLHAGLCGVRVPAVAHIFLFFKTRDLRNLLFSGCRHSFPGVKRPKREFAEVKSEWSYASAPPCRPSCHGEGQYNVYVLLELVLRA